VTGSGRRPQRVEAGELRGRELDGVRRGVLLDPRDTAGAGDGRDVVVIREGKNLKGRMLGALVGTGGKRVLAKALAKTAKAIEARNYEAKAA